MKSNFFFHSRDGSSMVESDFKIPIAYINLYNSLHFFKIGFPYYEKVPRSQMASSVSESITITIDGITVRKRDLIKIIKMIQLSNIELLNYVLVIIDYYEHIEKYIFNTRKSSLKSNFNDGKLNRISIGKFDKILNNVNLEIENSNKLENQTHKKFVSNNNIYLFNERNKKIKEKHLRAKTNFLINKEKEIDLDKNENILDNNKIKSQNLNSSEIYKTVEIIDNSPKIKLKSINNENNDNYFKDQNNNSVINNIESLSIMIMVNTSDKKIKLIPENIVLEVLDEKNHKRINSLECYDPIQKEKVIINGDSEIFYPSFNKQNELNQVILLNNINKNKVAIKKVFLKSYIDKVIHKETLPETIKLFDIYEKEQIIPKTELKKLISQSRLAECLNSSEEILTLYDLKGNTFRINKKNLEKIYEKFIDDDNFKLNHKMKILDENNNYIYIEPLNFRNYNIQEVIKNNKIIHPYIPINEKNSYFEITNIKNCKKIVYSREKINLMLNSRNLTCFDINEIKLVLHPNNSNNELFKIQLPNNNFHYIKKIYFENIIYNLINNLPIYDNIPIENDCNLKVIDNNGKEIVLNIKNILLNYYTTNNSPYIKSNILNIDNITYYYNEEGQIIHKTEINSKNNAEINAPGIELFELININDLNQKSCFIRKPFIRNILYNKKVDLYSDIIIFDPINTTQHKINLYSIISKYNFKESDLDLIEIPISKIFIFIKDINGKEHPINKEMFIDANNVIKKNYEEKKEIEYIFVDDNDILFKPIIEKEKIKINSIKEWVQIKNIHNKKIYVYITQIKHILKGDYDNKINDNIINIIDSYGQTQKINILLIKKEINCENKNSNKILIIPEKLCKFNY